MARTPKQLAEYRRKRDFSRTAEPAGTTTSARARRARALRFIVQKHAATRLHFDLRLELDGVMKSWAVPKGPSTDPSDRRLAMHVEDHPMEYNRFEGTIPAGEYGGGTVMLWDRGTYAPNGDDAADGEAAIRRGYAAGRLKIAFRGKRLRGGYTLVRMRSRDDDDRSWLLIKERDDEADPARDLVRDEVTSVATGRTMEQIAAGRRQWTRGGSSDSATGAATSATRSAARSPGEAATKPPARTAARKGAKAAARKGARTPTKKNAAANAASRGRTRTGAKRRGTRS